MFKKNSFKPGDVVEFQVSNNIKTHVKVLVAIFFMMSFYMASNLDKDIQESERLMQEDYQLPKAKTVELEVESDTIETIYSNYQIIAWYLKHQESLRLFPYEDGLKKVNGKKVKRHSHGWGTLGEVGKAISLDDANLEFKKAFDKRYKYIQKRYPLCDNWEQLVLTSIRYNVGAFNRYDSELDLAIKEWNENKITKALLRYNTDSHGKVREGLTDRRKEDIAMLFMNKQNRQEAGRTLRASVNKKISKELSKKTI